MYGWEGAHEQIRALAVTAGLPASSTAFAFVHAVREVGAARVAVAATYPQDVTELFVRFLEAAGIEVVAARSGGTVTAPEVATWGRDQVLELVRAADDPRAEAVLVPDTAPVDQAPRRSASRSPSHTVTWLAVSIAGDAVRPQAIARKQ